MRETLIRCSVVSLLLALFVVVVSVPAETPKASVLPNIQPLHAAENDDAATVPILALQAAAPVAPGRSRAALAPVLDQPNVPQAMKDIANEALHLLPERCQGALHSFSVVSDPQNRGQAGRSTIIMTDTIDLSTEAGSEEWRALFFHELGHVVSLSGCLGSTGATGPSGFRDGADPMDAGNPALGFYRLSWSDERTLLTGVTSGAFASTYGMTDAHEDFAEFTSLMATQPQIVAQRSAADPLFAAKAQWMADNVFGTSFRVADGVARWDGTVLWDVTKLPYQWLGAPQQEAIQATNAAPSQDEGIVVPLAFDATLTAQ